MQYFGTNLTSAGHYFWDLDQNSFQMLRRNSLNYPFDPETMESRLGEWETYYYTGYSVLAFGGSPYDKRTGCRSVFIFPADHVKVTDMALAIVEHPVARQILEAIARKITFDCPVKKFVSDLS